jgi:riboflavin kinase/FMN adenylyltransferase
MQIYRKLKDIVSARNTVLTIGSFDGLHRGHQEIIGKVTNIANAFGEISVVMTFDPHPKQILSENSTDFEILLSQQKKEQLLEELGVDITVVIPFDLEFSRKSAKSFVDDIICSYFSPQKIIVGYDHHFGFNREGNSAFLEKISDKYDFLVEVVNPVKDQDEVLSSTRIRNLITDGHVQRASFELGWVFGFNAKVVHGSGRGRNLNYPTANFVPEIANQLVPGCGVYFARAMIGDECIYGMCNLGYRPTFGEDEFVMEIHFFESDITNNLYNKSIEIQFLERIRDEKKFESTDSLIRQLDKDREFCYSRMTVYKEVQ